MCANRVRLALGRKRTLSVRELAVELSAALGFHSESMEFPVALGNPTEEGFYIVVDALDGPEGFQVTREERSLLVKVADRREDVLAACRRIVGQWGELVPTEPPAGAEANPEKRYSSDEGMLIPSFQKKGKKGLEFLFEKDYLLEDRDFDQLPDALRLKFLLDEGCGDEETLALCNLAARFGMELVSLQLPLCVREDDGGSNLLRAERGDRCGLALKEEANRLIFQLYGQGKALTDFTARLAETFPYLAPGKTWASLLEEMQASFRMKNLDGQLAWLEANRDRADGAVCCFSPKVQEKKEALQREYPNTVFEQYNGLEHVYEETFDLPWEVELFRQELEQTVYPRIQKGDQVEILAALSEDRDLREELAEQVRKALEEKGAAAKATILCAYKQGVSWIDEVIVPKLQRLDTLPARLKVEWKAFLPEGQTQWSDEEGGAVPKISSAAEDTPDRWFDLPIRFLQELYPADDIIAEKTGLARERVVFEEYKGEEPLTYRVTAEDEAGNTLFEASYQAETAERSYLDEYPGIGLVHPSTGYIKVRINGALVLERRIRTDLEAIWDAYQSRVLPFCKQYIDKLSDGKPMESMQPFFSRLRLDITASEPEYRLNSREDMISPLNALHEDLYFAGLDFFKTYGIRTTGQNLDAPGLILPVIKAARGKPSFRFTLYKPFSQVPEIRFPQASRPLCPEIAKEDLTVRIVGIQAEERGLQVMAELDAKCGLDLDLVVQAYGRLWNQGSLSLPAMLKGASRIVLQVGERQINLEAPPEPEPQTELDIREIDLMEDRLIGYEDYLKIIGQLKRVKGLCVYPVAESYQGRDVYAIELAPDCPGYLSRVKRINRYPTELINARHHANEVSSTNGAFLLLRQLLTEEPYQKLTQRMNLVFIPFENPDGAAIHYQLQKDNPNWKFHIARFNSVGKEFYRDYFNPDTIHTEAFAFRDVWLKWLPDVVTDNHGVPSHEWEQQFSGYTSPWFKGFWLPRALLYGYYWYIDDPRYRENFQVNEAMQEVIADGLLADEEIMKWNNDWRDRFEKYAHQWMPNLFPANYYKSMINYWLPYGLDQTGYTSVKFPWITAAAFTSEVADETAQGEYLALCARTHALHDRKVIDLLMASECVFDRRVLWEGETIVSNNIRKRPILCGRGRS